MTTDLIMAIVRLRRSLSRAATVTFVSSGVGARQLGVLRELRHAGPLSQVELARSTATDPAGLMRTIDALEARGWVQRTSSAHDRRCKIVSLTAWGRREVQGLDAPFATLSGLADGALSAAERKQFVALAGKLTTALEAAAHAAPAPRESVLLRTRAAGRPPENR